MAKHIERTQKTKEKLTEAFWELYCENKIEKITVKAITDKAGLYRSTFYEYFSDVYQVLEEIELELLKIHRNTMEEILSKKNFEEAKQLGFGFCRDNAKYLAVLLGPDGDPKFISTVKDHISRCLREVLNIDSDKLEIQLAFEMVSSSIISILTYWYKNKSTVELEEIFPIVMTIMQKGVFSLIAELDIPVFKA